jgi:hypothetical protein
VSSLLRPSSSACRADRLAACASTSADRPAASACWRLRVLLLLCSRAAAMSRDTAQRCVHATGRDGVVAMISNRAQAELCEHFVVCADVCVGRAVP